MGKNERASRTHVWFGVLALFPHAVGVIYVMDRAMANGFHYGAEGWSNFGQGAPETGDIPGAAPKPATLDLAKHGDVIHEYGPTTGTGGEWQALHHRRTSVEHADCKLMHTSSD